MSDEDEFFHKRDQEAREAMKAKLEAQRAEAELAEAKALHHLMCGKCGTKMDTKEFRGVEIEVCPNCGAVLLDPGELETLAGEGGGDFMAGLFSVFGKSKSKS